ncbi:hypothetical protein SISSUDRAFT_1032844 [Sistotremastrum suecicum HHB10207 ss-3]|uniref:Uncharacterized protein n=1 Tax=Sistotremastrum suecicum HHB10207 ss-3 TaxID=1314776 RepID=A0A166E4D5_9AGAM|nr:hypothetical protein SISSUDRAFT_1032844 [Sistotremastrum suecicum HHB10207 ss-3]
MPGASRSQIWKRLCHVEAHSILRTPNQVEFAILYYLIISGCAYIVGFVSPEKVIRLDYAFFCIISDNTFGTPNRFVQATQSLTKTRYQVLAGYFPDSSYFDIQPMATSWVFDIYSPQALIQSSKRLLLNTGTMVKVVGTTQTAISFLSIGASWVQACEIWLLKPIILDFHQDILRCWYHSFCTITALPRHKSCSEHYQSEPTTLVESAQDYVRKSDARTRADLENEALNQSGQSGSEDGGPQ